MGAARIDMHRLQEVIRLHRLCRSRREIARQLHIGRNTVNGYVDAISKVGLLDGAADDLPAVDVLRAVIEEHIPSKQAPQQTSTVAKWRDAITRLRDAKDLAHSALLATLVDLLAQRTDRSARTTCTRQELQRRRRRLGRTIRRMDRAPSSRFLAMLAQQLAGARIEQAHQARVPLDRHLSTQPAGRCSVVRGVDLHASVEVDCARAVAVVLEALDGKRLQRRTFLREGRGDLALGRAVDARVRPALGPAIEIRLGFLEALEAHALERYSLRETH